MDRPWDWLNEGWVEKAIEKNGEAAKEVLRKLKEMDSEKCTPNKQELHKG
jgi:hypothetical protein